MVLYPSIAVTVLENYGWQVSHLCPGTCHKERISWKRVDKHKTSVMVNFTYQLDWAHKLPKYLVKKLFWVFLWGYFLMSLTHNLVDWVKQIDLPKVGGPHFSLLKAWIEQIGCPPLSKREFFLPNGLWTGTSAFPAFRLELKMSFLPGTWDGSPLTRTTLFLLLVPRPLDSD